MCPSGGTCLLTECCYSGGTCLLTECCYSGGTCLLAECCLWASTIKIQLRVLVYYKVDIIIIIIIPLNVTCSCHDLAENCRIGVKHQLLTLWLIVIICTWCNVIMRLFFCERVKEKFEDKKLLSKVRFVQSKNKIINMCNTKTSFNTLYFD
jgi:hypothetical protein